MDNHCCKDDDKTHGPGWDRRHLAVWAMACALCFPPVFRLSRLLAYDFATLIANIIPDTYKTAIWIPLGVWSLRVGSFPVLILFVADLFYRLLGPRWGIENPLVGRSRRVKALVAVSAFLPFVAFCVPFAIGISVWLSVEASPWIEWYRDARPTILKILLIAPPYVAFLTLLFGLFMLRFALAGSKTVAQTVFSRAKSALYLFALAGAIIALIPVAIVSGLHASRVVFVPGADVFERFCIQCHALWRPLYFINTPAGWRRTVTRTIAQIKEAEQVPMTEKETEEITGFLNGMRSFSDSWIFRTRCQRCHWTSYLGWEKRKPEEWGAIAGRIARWSPYYYNEEVRDQLAAHLVKTRSTPDATLGLTPDLYAKFHKVDRACSSCHSLSRAYERYQGADPEEVFDLVRRMGQKTADPAIETDPAFYAETYQELISDMDRFERLFPHDRPPTQGGP